MDPTGAKNSIKGGVLVALGVIVLLLGTATGSATAMLAIAVAALFAIGSGFLRGMWRNTMLVITFAAATATMFAIAITKL